MKNTNLFIFDGQTDALLTLLSIKNNKQLPYFDDEVTEQLNKDYVFDFSVPMEHADSQYLVKGNRVVFKDRDDEFQEFQIFKTEEEHNDGVASIKVYTEHAIYEINDDIVEDMRVVAGDVTQALDKALASSRWKRGKVDSLGNGTVNFYYSNGMQNLTDVQKAYGGEYKFRVTLNANKTAIQDRFVDLLVRRGADTGKRFEYTKDINSIKRTVDMSGIKTALYGRGNGEELETGGYSRRITFANVEWSKSNGDPADKVLGKEWLGDPEALKLYGRQGGTRHRFDTFEVDSTDPMEILVETYKQLQLVNKPKITIEVEGQDLEIVGLDHEAVRLGDSVFIIDKKFNPILRYESRVIEIRRSLTDPQKMSIILGNFLPLSTDLAYDFEELKASFNDRKGVWDKVEDITVEDITDGSFADTIPNTPTGLVATGLFKSIAVEWDFVPSSLVATYEVYGSKIKGFTVDPSNLLYRGKTGGYVHAANTNETWYFRIRAANTHGRLGALTAEVSGSTIRIETADYQDLSIVNAKIADLSVDAAKIAKASITDAEIKTLNADKIVAGKVKAQFVEIGTKTVFETGFDPSKKASTTDVTNAEANAKKYADGVAKAEAALAEAQANANTEGVVESEALARIAEAEANLAAAKAYAVTKANEALNSAKDYAKPSVTTIFDPAFAQGKDFWSASYEGLNLKPLTTGTIASSVESIEGGNVLRLSNTVYGYSLNPIAVNTNRVYRVTFRVRQTKDTTIAGTSKVYAGVATLDKDLKNLVGGAGTHRYCAAAGVAITVADGWQTFTGIITDEGDLVNNFRAGTKFVRPMFIVNHSGGNGEVEIDLVGFEDITEIQDLSLTISEVALRTTEDAIIGTVSKTLEGKADVEALNDFATMDELDAARTDLAGMMDGKIDGIDFSPYATKTEVKQTASDLDFKFTSSGGVNLLKNSVGFAGTDFWTVDIDKDSYGVPIGMVDTRQDPELGEKGVGSGFILSGGKISQTIVNSPQFHTISLLVNKGTSGTGYVKISYDGKVETITFDNGTAYIYEHFKKIIEPEGNTITIELYGSVGSELTITAVMLNVGNVPLQWQHSSGELYNTNVLMDLNGIKVISSQYNGYTSITPEEFSGFAEVDGEMKRVFTLNKDVTEMSKVKIEKELSMSPIKVVPIQSTTYNGWAFIEDLD